MFDLVECHQKDGNNGQKQPDEVVACRNAMINKERKDDCDHREEAVYHRNHDDGLPPANRINEEQSPDRIQQLQRPTQVHARKSPVNGRREICHQQRDRTKQDSRNCHVDKQALGADAVGGRFHEVSLQAPHQEN